MILIPSKEGDLIQVLDGRRLVMCGLKFEELDKSQFVLLEPAPSPPREGVWYKKYPKLPSSIFAYENSGKCSGEAPPYNVIYRKDGDVEGIKGEWGMDRHWKVLGYTEQPPFLTSYESVAVMFEEQATFEKRWWHYPKH